MAGWSDRIAHLHSWMHSHRKLLLYAFSVLVLATAALDKTRLVIAEVAIFLNICIWYFSVAEDLRTNGTASQDG